MSTIAPPGRAQYIPEAREDKDEAVERYESIARDAIGVVYDPAEKPLFTGNFGRIKTLDVLLSVASFESGFRRDVDFGEGRSSKGDEGRSWCLNQINLGKANSEGRTPNRIIVNFGGGYRITSNQEEGWGGQDLVADRKKCFHAALAVLRSSFASCGKSALQDKLRVYASGSCERGEAESRRRMSLANFWMTKKMPPFNDDDVMAWLATPEEKPQQETETAPLELRISYAAPLSLGFSQGWGTILYDPRKGWASKLDSLFGLVSPVNALMKRP